MSLKKIYLPAIQKVIDGELSKNDLWDVLNEHLTGLRQYNDDILKENKLLKTRHKNLMDAIKEVEKHI